MHWSFQEKKVTVLGELWDLTPGCFCPWQHEESCQSQVHSSTMQTGSWVSMHIMPSDIQEKCCLSISPSGLLLKISGFQSRCAFVHPPAASPLQTSPCTTPDTSPCTHQAGNGNSPLYPVCATLSAVLLKARMSNICVNSLGTREG